MSRDWTVYLDNDVSSNLENLVVIGVSIRTRIPFRIYPVSKRLTHYRDKRFD